MKSIVTDSRGVAHLLLAGIIIVVGVASFGTYQYVKSNANSFSKNGVKVSTPPVIKTPAPVKTTSAPVATPTPAAATATELNESNQKVAAPNAAKCAQLGRVWSQNICAWSAKNQPAPNKFCVNKNYGYTKANPYDYCVPIGPQ